MIGEEEALAFLESGSINWAPLHAREHTRSWGRRVEWVTALSLRSCESESDNKKERKWNLKKKKRYSAVIVWRTTGWGTGGSKRLPSSSLKIGVSSSYPHIQNLTYNLRGWFKIRISPLDDLYNIRLLLIVLWMFPCCVSRNKPELEFCDTEHCSFSSNTRSWHPATRWFIPQALEHTLWQSTLTYGKCSREQNRSSTLREFMFRWEPDNKQLMKWEQILYV